MTIDISKGHPAADIAAHNQRVRVWRRNIHTCLLIYLSELYLRMPNCQMKRQGVREGAYFIVFKDYKA